MLPPRILVATDGSPAAEPAETFAAELAVAEGLPTIEVVYVVRETPAPEMLMPDWGEPEHGQLVLKEAAERIHAIVDKHAITVEIKLLHHTSVADAIINEAYATGEPSHIVMGAQGHGGLVKHPIGPVCHQVLQHAHCPVTVVRP
jgi:nucleotide-binding universal stress UspA family protein